MSTRLYRLTPVDAWFFRDGRPYRQSESSQAGVVSLFPPHPPTVVGALRAALARENGWNGRGSWESVTNVRRILGDGFADLGQLRVRGPYLCRRDDSVLETAEEQLWPLPAHVVGKRREETSDTGLRFHAQALLAPSERPVAADIGNVRVPVPTRFTSDISQGKSRFKAGADQWVTTAGLHAILAGDLPAADTIVASKDLWKLEPRVGIVRDPVRRTTSEGAMYSPLMIRLHRGVSMMLEVRGVPADWCEPADHVPVGGESRMAYCQNAADGNTCKLALPRNLDPDLNLESRIKKHKRLSVVHLSPADMFPLPGVNEHIPQLPGVRVVSACLRPPLMIGGWDSIRHRPLPLRPHVAPGSVWFCELDESCDVNKVLKSHGQCIGDRTAYGFGHVTLGFWPKGNLQ